MDRISLTAAAKRSGLSLTRIADLIDEGTLKPYGIPRRLNPTDVDQLILTRRQEAIDSVLDPVTFARQVLPRLRRIGGPNRSLPTYQTLRDLVGPHTLDAATRLNQRGCRWCWARLSADVHGGLAPQYDDLTRVLLDEPCKEDLQAMRDTLFGRKPHQAPADNTPPARTAAANTKSSRYVGNKACGTPVGVACQCHPRSRPAAARPSQPDDGSSLTSSRRTALTAALQSARDRGDRKHAQQLRGLLTALSPQAVRTSKKSVSTPRRVDVHGCGCTCPEHRSQS